MKNQRDKHRDELVELDEQIAAVAFLRADIDASTEAAEEIMTLRPDNIFAVMLRGDIHRMNGEVDKAEKCYLKMKTIAAAQGNLSAEAKAWTKLGLVSQMQAKVNKAELMYNNALKHVEKDGEWHAVVLGNLGHVYFVQGKLDKAEVVYSKLLDISERLELNEMSARQFRRLAELYQQKGMANKAKQMFEKASTCRRMKFFELTAVDRPWVCAF